MNPIKKWMKFNRQKKYESAAENLWTGYLTPRIHHYLKQSQKLRKRGLTRNGET